MPILTGWHELSARTDRPLRTLTVEHSAYSADPGNAGWYIGTCLLLAADVTGNHRLVSCDRFGRLDRARFTALPASSSQPVLAVSW